MNKKRYFIKILSNILIFPLGILDPFEYYLKRFYYFLKAARKITNLDPSVQFDGTVYIQGTRNIMLGMTSRIGSFVELETVGKGKINIGSNVRINRGCTICSYSDVNIGDYTLIGEYTSIRDANHGTDSNELIRMQDHVAKEIEIGNDVWIGRGSCILPGVKIGHGSVIGANSVVTKNIPALSIAVGAPARVIKKRN